jgi:TonB family protein
MHDDPDPNPPPLTSTVYFRRQAAFVFVAFVALSAVLHFSLGPEITKMSPHWAVSELPDQVVAIVTLSHKEQREVIAQPTPTPTPPPSPMPRTKRDLALLKYKEMGSDVHLRPDVRPPARRRSTIVLERAAPLQPSKNKDADVVAAMPEPTPRASQAPGPARVDTGGRQEELSGSIEWGDDNPVRLIKSAPLGVDDRAPGTARVAVQVGPDGGVTDVQLVQSSGDATVDQAALASARASTYAPATLNGMPVHGTCIIDFPPPGQST